MSHREGLALRSLVYHEILAAYLNYVKARGFTSMFIWACPPMAVRASQQCMQRLPGCILCSALCVCGQSCAGQAAPQVMRGIGPAVLSV